VHAYQVVICRVPGTYELLGDSLAKSVKITSVRRTNRSCDVGNVHPSIAFTGEVHPPFFHAEEFDEILPEPDELHCKFFFGLDVWLAFRIADTQRLVNPDNVREVEPGERVWRWAICPWYPVDWSVLSQQPFHRTTTGSAVHYHRLVDAVDKGVIVRIAYTRPRSRLSAQGCRTGRTRRRASSSRSCCCLLEGDPHSFRPHPM
jgi:hypothetical protein